MNKNYRWMWLRPLRKDKRASKGYVVASKAYGFFCGPAFLRGRLDQSTLTAGYCRKNSEKDESSERSSHAPRGSRTNECFESR